VFVALALVCLGRVYTSMATAMSLEVYMVDMSSACMFRPSAHLFGHAHEPSGVHVTGGVLFSNAAMACNKSAANVIDFYVGSERQQRDCYTQPQYMQPLHSQCLVM